MFRVLCPCGVEFHVAVSDAGAARTCQCGQELVIPRLSILKSHHDRGEAAPAAAPPEENDREQEVPTEFVAHFSGDVGPDGRVSGCAMENYVGVLLGKVNAYLHESGERAGFELMVSCAVLPGQKTLVQVECSPPVVTQHWREALAKLVRETEAPPVEEGPVAFVIYRRMNLRASTVGLQPFSQWMDAMNELGVDEALMQAGGLVEAEQPSLWRRLLQFVWPGASRTVSEVHRDTPQETYQKLKARVQEIDRYFEQSALHRVQRLVVDFPDNADFQMALAAKYVEAENWSQAIKAYEGAINLLPNFAMLYGRRGRIYEMTGNSQAALADYNEAISLAPFDSAWYAERARIYADLGAWPQAEDDLTSALAIAPRDPEYLLIRATTRIESSKYELAVEDLLQALQLDPHNGHAHRMLGWIYQETDLSDTNLSIDHFTKAIELVDDDMESRVRRGFAYASQNKFAMALEDCDSVIASHPDLAPAHGVRGRVLQMQGEYESAIESCTRAIELGLETAMVYLARGASYAATEQTELAIADCDAALELEPENPLALHLRGTLDFQNGALDAAMEAFNKARELAPDWNEPREHLALLHRIKENPDAAAEEQSALVDQDPKNPAHYVNRAFAYAEMGKYDEARADYDHAHELDPENDHILYLRGMFFMDRQEYDLALQDFDRALELDSDHDAARLQRATTLVHLKRYEKALEDYAKLIAKHPDDPNAYIGRGYAFHQTGDAHQAEKDFERLMDIVPEQSEQMTVHSLTAKASSLRAQEQYEEALELAEQVISMAPDDYMGYQLRAGLHWDLEQFVEACEDLNRVLEIEADQTDALRARGHVQAEQGEWLLALDDLDRAIELSRESGANRTLAFALSARGLAFAGLGRIEESTRDFDESVSLCPNNPWVYFHRGMVLYQREEYDAAQECLEKALELEDPPLPLRKKRRARTALESIAKRPS